MPCSMVSALTPQPSNSQIEGGLIGDFDAQAIFTVAAHQISVISRIYAARNGIARY